MSSAITHAGKTEAKVWTYATRPGRGAIRAPYYISGLAAWIDGPSKVPETVGRLFDRMRDAHKQWEQRAKKGSIEIVHRFRKTPKMTIPRGVEEDALYLPDDDWIQANGHVEAYEAAKADVEDIATADFLNEVLRVARYPYAALKEIHEARAPKNDAEDDEEEEETETGEQQGRRDEKAEDVEDDAGRENEETESVESVEDSDEELNPQKPNPKRTAEKPSTEATPIQTSMTYIAVERMVGEVVFEPDSELKTRRMKIQTKRRLKPA